MSKLFVVFGATGLQGGSVVESVLRDSTLSKEYAIRAVTRDTSSSASQELKKKGVEVVTGDVDNVESVKRALQGAHTVFNFTATLYSPNGLELQVEQAKTISDAAVAAGAQYMIASTMTPTYKLGYKVDFFDAKGRIEDYIRTLSIKSAFFWPGMFMENFRTLAKPRPVPDEPGVYQFTNILPADLPCPFIETAEDTGKFITPILANPDKFNGKVVYGASRMMTWGQVAEIFTKVSGKTVRYLQLPDNVFKSFLPPDRAEPTMAMFTFVREKNYYGRTDEKEAIEETWSHLTEKLTSLDEFLKNKPIQLD